MMDSEENVKWIMSRAKELGLDGANVLDGLSAVEVAGMYNGIGPEFLDAGLRAKVTSFLSIFEPAAMIHDVRYSLSDGQRTGWIYANYEFFVNCRKCARRAYSWWNWKRYRAYVVAQALYDFVSGSPGWTAWCDARSKKERK